MNDVNWVSAHPYEPGRMRSPPSQLAQAGNLAVIVALQARRVSALSLCDRIAAEWVVIAPRNACHPEAPAPGTALIPTVAAPTPAMTFLMRSPRSA